MFDRMVQSKSKYIAGIQFLGLVVLLVLICVVVMLVPGIPERYRDLVTTGVVGIQAILVLHLSRRWKETVRIIRESLGRLTAQLRKSGIEATTLAGNPATANSEWGDKYAALCEEINKIIKEFSHLKEQCATAEVRSQRYSLINQRLGDLLNIVPYPILLIDVSGKVLSCNRAAQADLGIHDSSASEQIDDQVGSLFHHLIQQVKKNRGANSTFDWQITSSNGQTTHYRVLVRDLGPSDKSARPDSEGERAIVLQDLTPLQELQKRHAEFVSAASHEMKAPLAAIRAYTELLLDGDAADEQTREEFIATIDTQAQRLQRLVENLLNIARIE
ncbi:MAG: histidine kinase dimerization/phospho-acceptor domain-containing protein, partial [Thermogutta sp.]